MGAEKWKFLQDEPCAQEISYTGDRIPSFLPNCIVADHSWSFERENSCDPYKFVVLLAEATISRKAECIVITWCLTFTNSYSTYDAIKVRLRVFRRDKLVFEDDMPVQALVGDFNPTICCMTLRRKHPVVEAVEPGDRLKVLLRAIWYPRLISTWEANVCVVYDEGGDLLLEVNSELFNEGESRKLEVEFGELVLKYENHDENQRLKRRRK